MQEHLLATIGLIYETALAEARWSPALDRVADVSGASGGLLIVRDGERTGLEITTVTSRINSWDVDDYVAGLHQGAEQRWVDELDRLPARAVISDEEVWDPETYNALPSVQWMNHLRLHHRCAARLNDHSGWWDAVALLYRHGRQGVQPEERQVFHRLLPHLSRAVATQRPFVLLERHFRAVLSVLDRLGIGVLFVTGDRRLVLLNRETERILLAGDGLRRTPDGRIEAPGDAGAHIGRALQRITNATDPATTASIAIPRPSGSEDYVLDLRPLRDGESFGEHFDGVLGLLIDPDHRAMVSTEGLASAYSLTPAESAVCSLIADGLSTPEIAEVRGVAPGTVKSQTKAIFEKTHTHNRSELIRRALSIVPPLLDEDGRRTN